MGEEVEKLVERLKAHANYTYMPAKVREACDEAAATLERVERERDEAIAMWSASSGEWGAALQRAVTARDAAERQVEALRKALEEIDGCFNAALVEGWRDALENGDIERIRDIWDRRIGVAQAIAAVPTQAEESSEQVDFAKVRVRSAGWWDDEDGEGRYFRFICALDGDTPPVWPLTKIWGSAFTLAPVSAPAEARSEQPVDPAAPTPRSDRRQPPAGYAKLPAGEHCKCIGLWQQAIGELWCCKGAAVDHG